MNNKPNTITMLAIFVALGVVLVAGLIAIPAIDQAHASDLGKTIRDKVHKHTDGLKDKIRHKLSGGGGGHHRQ
jgi:hypothetical protein